MRAALAALVLPLSPSPAPAWSPRPPWRRAPPAVMGAGRAPEQPRRAGGALGLATVLRQDSVRGPKRCPGRDDLARRHRRLARPWNARVKFSVLGDRQDKVTATRWVLGNAGGIRMALAGRLRQMARAQLQHVDVGKAVDVMVLLDQLSNERLGGGGGGGGGTGDDLDFEASEDDAFGDGEA